MPGGPSAAGARGPEAEGETLHSELIAEEVNGEKLSRPLREDIASSAVNATLKDGESLVTGGYKTRDGSHEITFLTPRVIRLEDGREAIEVSSQVVSLKEDAVAAAGLETIATNARNTLQHAEAWERGEVESALAAIRERAAQSGEGGGVSAAPKVIAMPSQPFSIGLDGEDGAYTLEAMVERGAEGGFTVRSRIEREEPQEASGKAPE